jgi:hypothetical protein
MFRWFLIRIVKDEPVFAVAAERRCWLAMSGGRIVRCSEFTIDGQVRVMQDSIDIMRSTGQLNVMPFDPEENDVY